MHSLDVLRRISALMLVVLLNVSFLPVSSALAQESTETQEGTDQQLFLPRLGATSSGQLVVQKKPTPEPHPNPDFTARVVGAISINNTTVRVVFNKSMSIDAIDPA